MAPKSQRLIDHENLPESALRAKLAASAVALNAYADAIFASAQYQFDTAFNPLSITERKLKEIGLIHGGTLPEVAQASKSAGLAPCPIEYAPYIRLAYQQQKVSAAKTLHQSPPDAITIFSERLTAAADFPRGFYLINIDNVLWLRGYCCDDAYRWAPDDAMIFAVAPPSHPAATAPATRAT